MSKSGVLGTLLPVLGGVAALGTGLGAAGIGPLAGLFSAGDAAAGAGTAAADAGLATAGDVGTAAALPATTGALDAGSFLVPGTDTALASTTPIATGSVGDLISGATPTITSLSGAATPGTELAANVSGTSDLGAGAAPGGNFFFPGTSSPFAVGAPAGDVSSLLTPSAPVDMTAGQVGLGTPFDTGLAGAGTSPDATAAAGGAGGSDFAGGGGGSDSSGVPWWQNPNNLLKLAPLGLFGLERLMNPSGLPPGGQAVQQAAQTAAQNEGTLTGQGLQNISYVNTGALPAGAQASIDAAANAAKAQVRSSFANMGIPAGSSMEAQQLAAVDQNAAAQKFAQQMQLLQAGNQQFSTAGGFGSQVSQADYELMISQIQQEQELEQALAGFAGAAALSGGFTGTTA